MSVPERYLGLTMPHEQDGSQPAAGSTTADGQPVPLPPYLERLAQHVGTHVDLDLLLQLAATIGPAAGSPLQQAQRQEVSCQQLRAGCCGVNTLTKVPPQPCRCRIAVARDEAFCFYYQVCTCEHAHLCVQRQLWQLSCPAQACCPFGHTAGLCRLQWGFYVSTCAGDTKAAEQSLKKEASDTHCLCVTLQDNLSLLRAAGAELLFFSPLRSSQLPPDISGIYFGGE